ncbi:MAG: histidine phosphatase family protein [Vicinamibacterales bacterium]
MNSYAGRTRLYVGRTFRPGVALVLALVLVLTTLAGVADAQNAPSASVPLRIYVARHGESESNVAGTLTGWTDSRLTARGRQQAKELAAVLEGVRLNAIYSSTLSRSRDTATVVDGRARRVQALDGLRERNWGRYTGGAPGAPEFLRRRALDDDSLDGGESRAAFYQRVRASVTDIRRQNPVGNVLIVGHGATNQQVLRVLLDLTAEQAETIAQANDEIYALDFVEGRPPLLWKMLSATIPADF